MLATIVHTPDDRSAFCSLPGFPLDPTVVRRQAPDRSVLVGGAARCSLWWKDTPAHEGHRLGYIGHFAVIDAGGAGPLLERACADLAKEGCTLAVGPIDGSTWGRYRLITERGSEPPYFLEPDNPDDWPCYFESAGFVPLAQFYSALCLDLAAPDPRMTMTAQRMADQGIVIRPLDLKRFDQTMHEVFGLSLLSF